MSKKLGEIRDAMAYYIMWILRSNQAWWYIIMGIIVLILVALYWIIVL